ncbi:MAG: T9SS type A sorting domain-containing protein [Saprospiraceae bacterium]|nr:T9SS type A sorting domain-containing protein [Saprospiraceae bacterium]
MKTKNTIKKTTLIFAFLFCLTLFSNAGSGSWNYIITGQNFSLPDTTNALTLNLSGGSMDDGIAYLAWPFNFTVYDNNYTTNDSITVSTNGFLRFDGIMANASQTGQIPSSNSLYGQFLSYGGDTDGEVQSPIKYKTSGTAPNRILTFVIQYNTDYNTTGYKSDVFISFYESNMDIKMQFYNTATGTTNFADEIGINAGDNTFYTDLGNFPTNDTTYLFAQPTFGPLDAGITHVFISGNGVGNRTIAAKINCFGTTTLTSDTIGWSVNSMMQTKHTWIGSLPQTNKDSVQIGAYNFLTPGQYTIKAWTTSPNGGTDTNHSNDTAETTFTILPYHTLPITEGFESGFNNFDNAPGNYVDFTLSTTYFHSGTKCAHNAHTETNENVLHETGLLNLSSTTHPYLEFYHIAKTEGNWDYCYVEISTDGGTNYVTLPDSVYMGSSLDYATKGYFHEDSYTTWGTSNTTPDNSTWWKFEKFDLKDYKVNNVRIRFNLVSDGSTNRAGWFIDDINIYTPYSLNLGADITTCGQSVLLQNTMTGANATSYIWKKMPSNNTIATTETFTARTSGNYILIANTTQGSFTDTINVTINPQPIAEAFGSMTICNGDSTTLYAIGNDLFFSEYIEGSSNNKALEIFNGTGMDVDLSNYLILQNANGGALDEYVDQLSGILQSGNTYVIAHPSANASILAIADTTDGSIANFNGDDARALAKIVTDGSQTDTITFNSNTVYVKVLDYIGSFPLDPGTGWNVAGVTTGTLNHTLVRKPEIYMPNGDWSVMAGTDSSSSEWIVYHQDYITNLGTHNYTNPNFTYLWSNSATTQSVTVNPTLTTTYQVTVSSTGGCSDVDSVVVDVSSPVVNLGNDTMVWMSTIVILDAGPGFVSYLWSTGDTTQTINVSSSGIGVSTISVIATNNYNCLAYDTINISFYINSITDYQNNINLNIFPNPSRGQFNLEIETKQLGQIELCLFNLQGQLISCRNENLNISKNIISYDLENLQRGVYYLRLKTETSLITEKIVIQ